MSKIKKENKFWKTIAYVALLASILGAIAEVLNFINIIPSEDDRALQLTVYVQGIDGKPVTELQNSGSIIVDFGNDRRAPLIGEKGRTNLGEIPEKFKGKNIPLVLEADGYEVAKKKEYIMNGEPIYFIVKKESSRGAIGGIVKNKDGNEFIEGALVMIDHDTTTYTDSFGRFSIQMPLSLYRDQYLVTVIKEGYETYQDYLIPQSPRPEIWLNQ